MYVCVCRGGGVEGGGGRDLLGTLGRKVAIRTGVKASLKLSELRSW